MSIPIGIGKRHLIQHQIIYASSVAKRWSKELSFIFLFGYALQSQHEERKDEFVSESSAEWQARMTA